MTMILENNTELLRDGLQQIFERRLKEQKDYRRELFDVQTTDQYIYATQGYGEMGLMEKWTDSNRQVAYEDVNKGYAKNFTQEKYSKGFVVEDSLLKFDRYREIAKKPRKLARAVHNTYQYYAIGTLGRGFTSWMTGPDSLPLFSSAHPVAPGSGTTYDNSITGILNADNLEAARNSALENWKDDKGNLILPEFDTIVVPPSLRKAALVIADSDGEVDTSDNNVNIWKGALNVIEIPLLARWSTTAWFLIDKQRSKEYLAWFDSQVPSLQQEDKPSFDTGALKYKVEGWFAWGWTDASFVIGSTGTTAS